ncbi:MAG: hypothetical protein HDQ93_03575, partial [Desulfovibrio sp.]|nr:hypothetical protein [Desulfovibrio sp.]
MAKSAWRKIYVSFWNDEFARELSPLAKLIFLGILTHPLVNALGAIRQSPQGLAFDLGVPFDRKFRKAFAELSPAVVSDPRHPLIWARNFLKYNPPDNSNIVKGWLPMFLQLPECETRREILRAADEAALSRGAEIAQAFEEAFADFPEIRPSLARDKPNDPPAGEVEDS